MSDTMTELPTDHPMMKAWNEFCSTDEFKNALRWAIETQYDDGREIGFIQQEQHAKGSLWLAFTKGMEVRSEELESENERLREELKRR